MWSTVFTILTIRQPRPIYYNNTTTVVTKLNKFILQSTFLTCRHTKLPKLCWRRWVVVLSRSSLNLYKRSEWWVEWQLITTEGLSRCATAMASRGQRFTHEHNWKRLPPTVAALCTNYLLFHWVKMVAPASNFQLRKIHSSATSMQTHLL